MIDFVRIDNIDSLDRLREALVRYGSELEGALVHARAEIDRTLGYLGERFRHWKHQYEIWKAEAERRWRVLERCENEVCDGRWDRKTIHRPCSTLYETWLDAERRHRHAEACVEQVKGLIRVVEQARDAYERDAGRIQSNVRTTLARGHHVLGQTAARARALAAHRFGGLGLAPAGTLFQDLASVPRQSSASSWSGAASAPNDLSIAADQDPRWTAGTAGAHAASRGEGEHKEPEPDPEAAEGLARHPILPPGRREKPELEPPIEGAKERGF